jgi:hypothetical protein
MKNERLYYVYIWYIVETNEVFYVGKGKGGRYKQVSGRNKFFRDMYTSHNCDVRKIYENLTESEAFQKEQETIKWYRENTDCRLTNQTDGGEGSSGWVPPEEFKIKQSKIHKAQWQDEDFREKMTAIRTDENGPYKSREFREKIAQLVQGNNNPNYGNYWTEEMKQHLSEIRKTNGFSANENNPRATRIICIETGEVFDCIKFAMQKYNIKCEGSMTVALKHPVRTAGGKHWVLYSEEYLDDNYRLNYLINVCLLNSKVIPIICVEDKTIYHNATALAKHLALTETYVRYHLNTEGIIVYDNKTYLKLSKYKNYGVAV